MPIDIGSGVQYTAWEDIEVGGQYALVWRRYYSTALRDVPSAQGRGWRHGFDIALRYRDGVYFLQGPDGIDLEFDNRSGVLEKGGVIGDPHQYELRYERGRYCVYHWHDWESEVHRFVFQGSGVGVLRLDRVELPSGQGVALSYDASGRLVEVKQDVEERRLLLTYDAGGLITALHLDSPIGSREVVCTFQYDSSGRLVAALDARQVPHSYRYDDHHRLIYEQGRAGGAFYMKYDTEGRCVEHSGEGRYRYRRLSYNPRARITTVTDSLGHRTTYQLNSNGQAVTVALPNGAVTRREYDDVGRLVAETGPHDLRVEYVYDERGNRIETRGPGERSLKVTYDEQHLPTSVTEADGAVWRFAYERGALAGVVDPIGRRMAYIRDQRNVISQIVTPSGNQILIRHNPAWSEETYTDDYGLVVSLQFDQRQHVVAKHDARGLVRTYKYDPDGRLTELTEADGSQTWFVRDQAGQLVRHVTPAGAATMVEYSPYSDYLSLTNPNGATYRFSSDTEGRMTGITGPSGDRASFEFDAAGHLTRAVLFDGRVESYAYDLAGRCVSREKSDGTVIRFGYGTSTFITSVVSGHRTLVANTYDPCDQLVETVTPAASVKLGYDLAGNVVEEIQGDAKVSFSIGPGGFVETCRREGGSIDGLRFEYDRRGRLVALGTLNTPLQAFEYDAADLLIARRFAGLTESFEYDVRERPIQQVVRRRDGQQVVRRGFDYDRDSNLVGESDSLRGDVSYAYGPSGLLLRSQHGRRGAVQYDYDLRGNMLRRGDLSLEYERGNRLVRAGGTRYVRDENGNRVTRVAGLEETRYEWDALDQLTRMIHPDGTISVYDYDGLGRRIRKQHGDDEVRYFWAGDSLLSEVSKGVTRDYAVAEFRPSALWSNGAERHLIVSFRGLVQEMIDGDGALVWSGDYDDWGALLEGGDAGPILRLPGQQFDNESGLAYNRFRYYDPEVARFISADPLGLAGGFNGFVYAPNAIDWCDPLGLYCGKKGCRNTVYVLKKNGKIVYVGITGRAARTRMQEHAAAGKDFDEMTVVATGLTRRQARNMEGSALKNIQEGDVVHDDGTPMSLQNAQRRADPGTYYHSYSDTTSGPGRQVYTPSQTANQLNQNLVTYPNP